MYSLTPNPEPQTAPEIHPAHRKLPRAQHLRLRLRIPCPLHPGKRRSRGYIPRDNFVCQTSSDSGTTETNHVSLDDHWRNTRGCAQSTG
ncbi:hypothetical protein BDQ17DRAFT_1363349 [Cyathus striatus]|nr:hypothetical protein BDQ17DRAFT_1363349 [Cyathus striatus]